MIDENGPSVVLGYATDIVTDLSIDWIVSLGEDEPFCMLVHHKAPHRPWVPDEKHKHLYADGDIPEPETFFDDLSTRSKAVRGVHMTIAGDMGSEDLKTEVPEHLRGPDNREARMRWKYQIYMRDYLQCIQSIDDNVGRLLDHLDERGPTGNTLVVYTSDQGFFLGDHGWFDKRLMFDQSLQMPMLVRWPKEIAPGSRCAETITNVDFAATFLDVCGADAGEALPTSQGRSFRPLLRGERVEDWPDAMYYRYWEHDDPIHAAPAHYGIRTADHKLIHYYGAGCGVPGASEREFEPEWELYDLRADPTEVRNVADDPVYATVRAELETKLADYQHHYDDHPYTGPGTPPPRGDPTTTSSSRGSSTTCRASAPPAEAGLGTRHRPPGGGCRGRGSPGIPSESLSSLHENDAKIAFMKEGSPVLLPLLRSRAQGDIIGVDPAAPERELPPRRSGGGGHLRTDGDAGGRPIGAGGVGAPGEAREPAARAGRDHQPGVRAVGGPDGGDVRPGPGAARPLGRSARRAGGVDLRGRGRRGTPSSPGRSRGTSTCSSSAPRTPTSSTRWPTPPGSGSAVRSTSAGCAPRPGTRPRRTRSR